MGFSAPILLSLPCLFVILVNQKASYPISNIETILEELLPLRKFSEENFIILVTFQLYFETQLNKFEIKVFPLNR